MFCFSMRELITMTLAAAMAVAWVAEHRRLDAALAQVKEAKEEASIWERRCTYRDKEMDKLETGIEQFGFEVLWSCEIGPMVCKEQPDGTFTSIPNSNEP